MQKLAVMNQNAATNVLTYCYQFRLPEKEPVRIDLRINKQTTSLICAAVTHLPNWVDLAYQQCPNCPLKAEESPHCPVARNLIPLIDVCSAMASYQELDVRIKTPDRVIAAKTTAQRAVSSVLGLVMATSDCPHTGYLKPMARFHLPLASEEESIYRTTSMFLLAQYFRSRQGLAHRYDLSGLMDIYANLKIVNKSMAQRLRGAIEQDAAVNAVILLDLLTQTVTWSIEDGLEEIADLFSSYIETP
jgi:uncharacterized protein DUF6901